MLLITGATGMVGASVLARLIRSGRRCAVIAREKGKWSAEQRIDQVLAPFEQHWQTTLRRPIVFRGDLNQPQLGLDTIATAWINSNCDAILHSAASLSFAPAADNADGEPYRTNLGGTENVLRLARQCNINEFHHVSTAYVCGTRSGRVLETDADVGQAFANDYECSKVQAEQLLRQTWLTDRPGTRSLTVYRPSIVIDPIGLTPVSGDRTIYGAFSMYQMLAARFGLPADGQWFRDLGFAGQERKNLVDVHWIAAALETILSDPAYHGQTYHLTADGGTAIRDLDAAFRCATADYLASRPTSARQASARPVSPATQRVAIDKIAAPFVATFLPYFRDDPVFDRRHIDRVIAETPLPPPPKISTDVLLEMVNNWSAPKPAAMLRSQYSSVQQSSSRISQPVSTESEFKPDSEDGDDVVLCGYEVRLPGGIDDAHQFEQLLYRGESAITRLPPDRLDRELYLHPTPGTPGKTYTEIGGCVDPRPSDLSIEREIETLGQFDLTHRQFAQVALAAVDASIGRANLGNCPAIDLGRAGVFVGHSGGTEQGGALALATLAEAATRFVSETAAESVPQSVRRRVRKDVTVAIRRDRPQRTDRSDPELNAYSAASLTARLLKFRGRREVIDAACSSSLIALHHAATAINNGRLDLAVVGGATFNNVDNLALFSQTGACSAVGSYPFDSRASGLVSSEGYVAVVIAKRSVAVAAGMPVLATLHGVGISSDGKGKGLWAPRSEGQQMAMRRAVPDSTPLDIDYLECHATSTQIGDATELESLDTLLKQTCRGKLPIGSVKSNLGHLLEAAGLVGLVKCLIAMRRGEIPPSINFQQPTPSFDWANGSVNVVDAVRPWPQQATDRDRSRIAAVNAFGIGGLNAHAVFEQVGTSRQTKRDQRVRVRSRAKRDEPIAIVGRGLVLPGAASVAALAQLLSSEQSHLQPPPTDRWPIDSDAPSHGKLIGLGRDDADYHAPHAMGGYVRDFKFDAQSYRIPPKIVANANPAQLMLIEAVRQAVDEFDNGDWSIDRKRVGVTIGTMFGGQFSNELQIGLRLPEICRHLQRAAIAQGVAEEQAAQWAEAYRRTALAAYPALLDETGGFTASTLASRIARTFDLMGGACAVDADEASSGLAMLTAAEQLAAGHVDAVLCGTAQRSLDLVALEQLFRNGRLASSASRQELLRDPGRIFPAEGVAIILLQRLSDARKANRRILGTIDSISETFAEDVVAARANDCDPGPSGNPISSHKIVDQLGHLGGGHGLVQVIATTIAAADKPLRQPATITETASDGYQINVRVSHPDLNQSPASTTSARQHVDAPDQSRFHIKARVSPVTNSASKSDSVLSVCLHAHHPQALGDQLQSVAQTGSTTANQRTSEDGGECCAVIAGASEDEIRSTAQALLSGPMASGQSGTVAKRAGLVKLGPLTGTRVAWTFPGQGSQYAAIPRVFDLDPQCLESIHEFDQHLAALQLEPVGDRLHDPQSRLGRDVWWTQAWLLATGTALTESLLRSGMRPDVVLGHSFGECTAAWAAGVMSTRGAIEFAKSRSDAVTMHGGPRGELLSVRGEPSLVDSILRPHHSPCVITHHNSPNQTVIAGTPEAIAAAKSNLSAAGVASVVIPVPAAFHTPAMKPAREMLAARQSGARLRPPRFGFLSATQNRYLAEPSEIHANLIDQLIQPVGFSGAVSRLVADGCGLLLEVGPGNVLTRLAAATVGSQAICISADDPGLDIATNRRFVELASELFTRHPVASHVITSNSGQSTAAPATRMPSSNGHHSKSASSAAATAANRFSVIDVTRRGRRAPDNANGRDKPGMPSGNQPRPAIAPAKPTGETLAGATVATATKPTANVDAARSFLFDLVVDLTGYEPEIIEFDADLEAELGVDSIKKAQLIGELVQWAGLELTTQDVKLAEFQSMADILRLIPVDEPAFSSSIPAAVTPSGATVNAPETRQPTADASTDVDADALRQLMIDLLVDQTGYDESIIDMEADLESELGVDSIKRAQLLGELEQQFELPPIQQSDLKLADFPTLASIHDFIMDQVEGRKKKTPAPLASSTTNSPPASLLADLPIDVPSEGTHRFTLRMRSAPRRDGMPREPQFSGAALVVGDNKIADALVDRLAQSGVPTERLRRPECNGLDDELDTLWQLGVTPHLFLTTAHDADADWSVDDPAAFTGRRQSALQVPYRICQRWMQRAIDDDRMDQSSLVTVVRNGGWFGFDPPGQTAPENRSSESGAMAGLTKAMLIEAWMRGHRDTPMLVVDAAQDRRADEIVDGIWRELAVPSYDEEVVVAAEQRSAVAVTHAPLPLLGTTTARSTRFPLTRGGNWIVAGGGRGITAMTAMELAERHDLKLHLLGMAPAPQIDDETRQHALRDRGDLRRVVMRQKQAAGENPVKFWRQFEKAIEIDLTLCECRRRGIRAQYHCVNVSDPAAVQAAVAAIRATDGPIRGVIQGAGSGQDARFDRKRPDKVDQCLSAKIDGTVALASATRNDPLEWFVGFGSISGRFGANGHTDYSAANDMLAKLIGNLGRQRPQTRCVTFHWHAWGDVGMATKPEAKLALDMIGMKFMPAADGLTHFLNEMEQGGDASEVLITDRRYIRKFFHSGEDDRSFAAPLLMPNRRRGDVDLPADTESFSVTLDPARDLFLKEHLVGGKPTLPLVIATEILAQAGLLQQTLSGGNVPTVTAIQGVRAIAPLKVSGEDAFAVELVRDPTETNRWTLACDLRRRDGRLVEAQRKHFCASLDFADSATLDQLDDNALLRDISLSQQPIEYLPPDSAVYHGPSLRCLRSIGFTIDPASDSMPVAIGTIVAASPAHLMGEDRPLSGWITSPATMDAMLYAAGMLAGFVGRRASLPVSIEQIRLGRLPEPGEPLRVVARWLAETEDQSGGILSVVAAGLNNDLIAELTGYRVGWLG
ncbi:SDR family oxidoreductase [Stieleria sp. TO1_6]|uniref:type I polyketide synthase n=1 Tax=Stieleria tagensis TaxID=2956795 RepID=UPI00209A8458|nr:type I polyketide synthase [Stieleria tagensis]MCO8124050.1 SDR family oxidoreductase [Stieleria tagensis]